MSDDIKRMSYKDPKTGKVMEIAYSTQVQERLERTLSQVGVVLIAMVSVGIIIIALLLLIVMNTGVVGTYAAKAICN